MKTKSFVQTIKFIIIGMVMAFYQTGYAENTIDCASTDSTDSPSTVVTINVILDPDCPALQYCEWEVLIFDVAYCTQDNQPIAKLDYMYGDPVNFPPLTFNTPRSESV